MTTCWVVSNAKIKCWYVKSRLLHFLIYHLLWANSRMPFVGILVVLDNLSFNCFMSYCCLEAKSLESNFWLYFHDKLESWMIMHWVSQTGTEADDTAIIRSLRCSIDSLSTHSASLSLMESHDSSSWRNMQAYTPETLTQAHTTFASV